MGVAKRPLVAGEVCEDLRLAEGMMTFQESVAAVAEKAEKPSKVKKEAVAGVAEVAETVEADAE